MAMTRNNVSDDKPMYRVVIVKKGTAPKPGYDWRTAPRNEKSFIYTDELITEYYGPYNSVPVAKGQLTVHRKDYRGGFREDIVAFDIQKADVVWESVPISLKD